MIPILFVLFSLLDIQRPVIAADGMEKKFVVSELVEASLTGCAENPQSGNGFNGDPLTVNWLKSPEPTDSNVNSTWFPEGVSATESEGVQSVMSMRVMPVDPPNPNPDPKPGDPAGPPIAATPEPSSFAILGITAAVLLFLLFGRRCGRRFARRI